MRISDLRIGVKLGAGFLAVVLFTTLLGVMALAQMSRMHKAADEIASNLLPSVAQTGELRVLLNRWVDHLVIGPKQIESALGFPIHHLFTSDYKTVSHALNSGVPLASTNHSEISAQFDRFTRQIITPREHAAAAAAEPERKRRFFGLV